MRKTIRMTKLHASPNAVREAGQTYKVDRAEADRLIRSGAALLVDKPASQQQTGAPAAAAEDEASGGGEAAGSDQAELSADEPSDGDDHTCDECGFEAASAAGLANHQRTHADENDDGDDSEWTDEA